ncbi:hypothetical protein [Streptomyces sp. SID3343]|uniref:hypothetical protein n=1 Tax=Streptomyces sp. SID3343 TaxID=2690260 RepID=UPI00136E0A1C|nr:hypothetical protein [Streptomyces sp. SID3343]MYW04804.1 hypothetical protein [Streptomyces sp. SID3343]
MVFSKAPRGSWALLVAADTAGAIPRTAVPAVPGAGQERGGDGGAGARGGQEFEAARPAIERLRAENAAGDKVTVLPPGRLPVTGSELPDGLTYRRSDPNRVAFVRAP